MHKNERLDDHQKFKELCALAQGDELSPGEKLELISHLQLCDACRQVYDEYARLSAEGMSFLAAAHARPQEHGAWDQHAARSRLFSRLRDTERSVSPALTLVPSRAENKFPFGSAAARWSFAALAAGVVIAVAAAGAYHLGRKANTAAIHLQAPRVTDQEHQEKLASAALSSQASQRAAQQAAQIAELQQQISSRQQELARLHESMRATEVRASQLSALNGATEEQYRKVSEQRDKLIGQLHDAEQAYQSVQAELTSLRADRDRAVLQTASLQSKLDEITTHTQDQEKELQANEQYLASDRDIRELMGARKLYIADVFDVDSGSRTRKPFGRVFYTQSKSLIFYAFDLDHQPGVKNASAFQVWGQRDAALPEKPRPTNLGILYMDSESNRRWVLRFDDPKQLEQIDAVFVTIEPHGGSQKPTGKPFLYALLRKEANHP